MQGGQGNNQTEKKKKERKEKKRKRRKIHLGRGRDAAVCCYHCRRCPSHCPTPTPSHCHSVFPSPWAIARSGVCSCLSSRHRCCACFLSHPGPRCSHFYPTSSCSRWQSGVMWWWGCPSSSLSSPGCCGCHTVGVLGGPRLHWCPCPISSFPLPCCCCCCCPARVSTLQGRRWRLWYLIVLSLSSLGSVLAPTIHPASSCSQQWLAVVVILSLPPCCSSRGHCPCRLPVTSSTNNLPCEQRLAEVVAGVGSLGH